MDKIQSKSVELFYRGFFSEGLKVDKHIDHPSLRLKKTIQKHQVNKRKNSKRWVSCKNIPFQQESFIGTSSMDSCGVFNRFRCCIQFSRHRNTRAWDSWPWEKKQASNEELKQVAKNRELPWWIYVHMTVSAGYQFLLIKVLTKRDWIKDSEAIKSWSYIYEKLILIIIW